MSFINSGKQGRAAALQEGHDIVTGESCVPVSLKANNLGEIGCANLGKASEPHLTLLMPSSHRPYSALHK
jgi:hypothetical protein